MIKVSEEAKRLLSSLWAPDGEVLRLVCDPTLGTGSDVHAEELAFGFGRGEGADQIVQHDGRQVLRIAPEVSQDFDGSTVEPVDGALGIVPPGHQPLEGRTSGTKPQAREAGAIPIRDGDAVTTNSRMAHSTEEVVDNPPLEAQG